MILAENLGKRFGEFQAVDKINLNVKAGEVLALLGPNGAGKTTTVRMLASILMPSSGSAIVANFDTATQASKVRAHVGVLTENHGLYNRMPAGEYLDFFAQIYRLNPTERKIRIQRLLNEFDLELNLKQPIGEFSKGMRQKLALGRALLHNPPVLLLDEPTSAMDPESARLVRDSIRTLRSENRTIVICTHNLLEAEELADQIAIIRQGRIIAQGTSAELRLELLGLPEYELRLTKPINASLLQNTPLAERLIIQDGDRLRLRIADPTQENPAILRWVAAQGLEVISFCEVSRSLEQVYLQAIANISQGSGHAG